MPIAAAQRTGFSRWVHVKAGELAILFVCAVTLFSLCTQALYLGFQGSTIAFQLDISRLELILSVLPHALLELTALFLPLAAWLIASRRGEWNQLLAATFVTVLLAIPVLIVAATIEVYVWPHILEAISPVGLTPYALPCDGPLERKAASGWSTGRRRRCRSGRRGSEALGYEVDGDGAGDEHRHQGAARGPAGRLRDRPRAAALARARGRLRRCGSRRPLRAIPIVFVDGAEAKVAAIRGDLPDAGYASWDGLGPALRGGDRRAARRTRSCRTRTRGRAPAKPLAQKLGIKAGMTIVLLDAPDGIEATLAPLPDGVDAAARQPRRRRDDDLVRHLAAAAASGASTRSPRRWARGRSGWPGRSAPRASRPT